MALYHFSAQMISRSTGRSATAAAAYRSGQEIADQRTGQVHDYSRKGGVVHCEVLAPDGAASWVSDRSALWNAVEMAEKALPPVRVGGGCERRKRSTLVINRRGYLPETDFV